MLQTDRQTLLKIGGEDKTVQTDRRNPQGVPSPTVVHKRHVTNIGPQLTSFDKCPPKMLNCSPFSIFRVSQNQDCILANICAAHRNPTCASM